MDRPLPAIFGYVFSIFDKGIVDMKNVLWFLLPIAMVTPNLASAEVWQIRAHVTMAEASHVGLGEIFFALDQPGGNCPAGTYLRWQIEGDTDQQRIANSQAILATLITAKVSGQTVRAVGDMNACTAQLLYLEG